MAWVTPASLAISVVLLPENHFLRNSFSAAFNMDCSVLLVSSFILSFLFNRIVSKRKCIRNHWKQQTDEIKKCAFCSYEMFFSRKANLFFEAG